MITAKIFKVKQTTQNDGKKFYRVLGYDNKYCYLLGFPSFEGAKENETFMDALNQIDALIDLSVVSDKTIHVVYPKKSNPSKRGERVDVNN